MSVHHFWLIEVAVQSRFMMFSFCSIFISAFTGLYFFITTDFIRKAAILRWICLRLTDSPSLRRTLKILGGSIASFACVINFKNFRIQFIVADLYLGRFTLWSFVIGLWFKCKALHIVLTGYGSLNLFTSGIWLWLFLGFHSPFQALLFVFAWLLYQPALSSLLLRFWKWRHSVFFYLWIVYSTKPYSPDRTFTELPFSWSSMICFLNSSV